MRELQPAASVIEPASQGAPASPLLIEISWFRTLSEILSSYVEILRYELGQVPGMHTLEALIHSEIFKILAREFPSRNIKSEYPIGRWFKEQTRPDVDGTDGEDRTRRFRADIALFHPADAVEDATHPFAVFEIKCAGPADAIWADIYRLAVVSGKEHATGYFVLAAPHAALLKLVEENAFLKKLSKNPNAVAKMALCDFHDKTDIFRAERHAEDHLVFGQLLYQTDEQPGTATAKATISLDGDYTIRIFGFHAEARGRKMDENHRLKLLVQRPPPYPPT